VDKIVQVFGPFRKNKSTQNFSFGQNPKENGRKRPNQSPLARKIHAKELKLGVHMVIHTFESVLCN